MIIVVTPATVFDLVDISVIRAALGIVDQTQDEALSGFVRRASDVIARHCKRVFALEVVEEQFRSAAPHVDLMLSRYPVKEILSVQDGSTMLAASDYEADLASGMLMRLSGDCPICWRSRKVTVNYKSGYDLPRDTPPALQQATVQLVKAYYMGADRDPLVRSEGIEAVSNASYFATQDEYLPPDVRGLLKQFRKYK